MAACDPEGGYIWQPKCLTNINPIELSVTRYADIEEVVEHALRSLRLHDHWRNELEEELRDFLAEKVRAEQDELCDSVTRSAAEALSNILNGSDVIGEKERAAVMRFISRNLLNGYENEWRREAINVVSTDDDDLPTLYNNAIHSDHQSALLKFEGYLCSTLEALATERKQALDNLQTSAIAAADSVSEGHLSEHQASVLMATHAEAHASAIRDWTLRCEALRTARRAELREWLLNAAAGIIRSPPMEYSLPVEPPSETTHNVPSLHESFTIHLGSQLKTMHNLRLIAATPWQLISSPVHHSQTARLHRALGLYSRQLSGLVLLVDNRTSARTGPKQELLRICEQSAELHFPSYEEQLAAMGDGKLSQGDIYVTKHSNLNNVQVVFHVVCDSLQADTKGGGTHHEPSSRHPVFGALRNVMRLAHERDVKTVALPLFLSHELSGRQLDTGWAMRRAEMVYKCVKGYLIELASLAQDEVRLSSQRTVQFVVPDDISPAIFNGLSSALSSVFRMTTALSLHSVDA